MACRAATEAFSGRFRQADSGANRVGMRSEWGQNGVGIGPEWRLFGVGQFFCALAQLSLSGTVRLYTGSSAVEFLSLQK